MGVAKPARLLGGREKALPRLPEAERCGGEVFELEMPFSPHTLSLRPCATSHNEVKLGDLCLIASRN